MFKIIKITTSSAPINYMQALFSITIKLTFISKCEYMYFMLVLFTVWSTFFGFLAANYLGWFGYNTIVSIVIHIAVLLPLAFTNAIFVDAERDGANWLKEWKDEQSRYKLVVNRLKTKNLVIWNPNKES